MSLFTAKLDTQGKALELLSQRQKVLAGNIANADTPGFKARDFDFAQALAEAQGQSSRPNGGVNGGLVATSTRHLALAGPDGAGRTADGMPNAPLMWRTQDQPSLDGNSVDLDRERAHFADNAMRYEATLRFINSDVRTMLSAITGQ